MNIQLAGGGPETIEADVLLVLGFENGGAAHHPPSLNDWVADCRQAGEFTGKTCELVHLYRPSGLKVRRAALAGAGCVEKFNAAELRKCIGTAVRQLRSKAARHVAVWLDSSLATPENTAAAIEGALLGDYEPDHLKTDPAKGDKRLESLTVVVPEAAPALQEAADRGRLIGEAQNFARDLKNEPANQLTPLVLAERSRAMAEEFGLECEILDEDRMRQLGMGSLLGVAQGSAEPPALIVLRYVPEGAASSDHLALIGKGVTFDTGGISIKPADGMEKMKYDMGGGASVIGAMRALAQLKPGVRVTALIPTVENMVGSRAQRPGDIVHSLSGKTVEVLNTDAEGRLILIDAITYAIRLGCTHLVDAATLTGAIVVALGHVHIGAFATDDALLDRVQKAGSAAGERMWRMPLDDDYKDYLKSPFADLPNIGGRWGGAITAAIFLKEFTEDKPWVHLDIAGTAWLDEGKPWMAKGPSGVPVRTFINLAMNWTAAAT